MHYANVYARTIGLRKVQLVDKMYTTPLPWRQRLNTIKQIAL